VDRGADPASLPDGCVEAIYREALRRQRQILDGAEPSGRAAASLS